MPQNLNGMTVAVLLTDGFEQIELVEPKKALEKAGATVVLVSPKEDAVQGFNHDTKGKKFKVDASIEKAKPDEYDALLLPGGVKNPDRLRLEPKAVRFVKKFNSQGKPIAAICHGPWTLINAKAVKGRKMTSWPSLEQDLKNAGARWVNKEVVTDGNLVTSRKPADLPVFNDAMIALFAKSREKKRR